MSAELDDHDFDVNKVNGTLHIHGPTDQADMTKYVVYLIKVDARGMTGTEEARLVGAVVSSLMGLQYTEGETVVSML